MFTLTSARGGDRGRGAAIGTFVVTVRKYRNRLDDLGPMPDLASDPAGSAKWQAAADRLNALPPESLIPAAYGEPTTSPLRAEVKKGPNRFTFELSHTPPTGK